MYQVFNYHLFLDFQIYYVILNFLANTTIRVIGGKKYFSDVMKIYRNK